MALPLMHHGMLLMGLPFTEPDISHTQQGGTPYGASHVSGAGGNPVLSDAESRLAFAQGRRLAIVALKLSRP
jgi:NAD(P)H dehydrogenase (quinone)